MKVLLIEDNAALSKNIIEYLKLKWIKAEHSFDSVSGMQKIQNNHYDILILDINIPGWKDWLQICRELREKWNNISIIMLTSRNTTKDVIEGLNIWADDYLGKPFDMEELVSRLEALYRRNAVNKSNTIILWDIEIDTQKRSVEKNWENITLSTLEFDLLKYLAQNRWVPVDRKTLFEKVWWDFDWHMLSRTVDMYISYLRKKLWDDIIETKKWFWYLIN